MPVYSTLNPTNKHLCINICQIGVYYPNINTMPDPPDLPLGQKTSAQPLITFDKTKTLKIKTCGPKYLVMSRKYSEDTLANVSPFLIKKVIDYTARNEVETCKKLRNGNVLIKTKNHVQADKLVKLVSLSPTICIEVSEHSSLNFTNLRNLLKWPTRHSRARNSHRVEQPKRLRSKENSEKSYQQRIARDWFRYTYLFHIIPPVRSRNRVRKSTNPSVHTTTAKMQQLSTLWTHWKNL